MTRVVISRSTVESLGSMTAIIAHFEAAEFVVPPLVIRTPPEDHGIVPATGGYDVQ